MKFVFGDRLLRWSGAALAGSGYYDLVDPTAEVEVGHQPNGLCARTPCRGGTQL